MEEKKVDEFSRLMLHKLNMRHDRYASGGWQSLDFKRIVLLLEEELRELKERHLSFPFTFAEKASGSPEEVRKLMMDNTVDIANYAMFLWDLLNPLDK